MQTINGNAFHGLENSLETLNIEDTTLKATPTDALTPLHSLKTLRLDNTDISKLERNAFQGLLNLLNLFIIATKLTSIDESAFVGLNHVVTVHLACPLREIQGVHHLGGARVLSMTWGHFANVRYSSFPNNSTMKTLVLERNGIERLFPEAVERATPDTCPTPTAPTTKFPLLQKLKLNFNRIRLLPKNFRFFPNLRQLFLHSSQISHLPEDAFHCLRKLERLELSQNQIQTVPRKAFLHLSKLRSLLLNGNRIGVILDGVLLPLKSLQSLNVRSNQLKSFTREMFTVPMGLDTSLNPVHCTCALAWVRTYQAKLARVARKSTKCANIPNKTILNFGDKTCNLSSITEPFNDTLHVLEDTWSTTEKPRRDHGPPGYLNSLLPMSPLPYILACSFLGVVVIIVSAVCLARIHKRNTTLGAATDPLPNGRPRDETCV